MSRPLALRMQTTSHCVPTEPSVDSPRSTAPSLTYSSSSEPDVEETPRPRRASTVLVSQNAFDVRRIVGEPTIEEIKVCCGGGCLMGMTKQESIDFEDVPRPDNDAFRALGLKFGPLPKTLSNVPELPPNKISLTPIKKGAEPQPSPTDSAISVSEPKDEVPVVDFTPHQEEEKEVDTKVHPPNFVQPHPPYNVHSAKIWSARELTKPGAEKRTYHFDLDVTDYPSEAGVDFKVGGAIGVMAPNEDSVVDEVMDLLLIPRFLRDRPVLLKTENGRWPTVWGDEQARELVTTRRDLLAWCCDLQSYPPTKHLLRLLAEYATSPSEKKILLFLTSAEGQGTFCDFRTGPHITIPQLLHAFPSSKPPLDHLMSQLQTLMPRFYSLSNDPVESCVRKDGCHRLIEIAVTVHETPNWSGGLRTGTGSGFFERQAQKFLSAQNDPSTRTTNTLALDLRIPIFRGLMANPLAREFISDGPMLLIGAGVGVAPFRGFVQRRLKNANCANKVWVLQGVRDSLLDELYSGEWGVHEDEVKKVVQSRKPTTTSFDDGEGGQGKGKYVQDEVRAQADLVWFIINSLDGRVFVCGSSKGMGEGVEEALVDVAVRKGNLGVEEARKFWKLKGEAGQYIAETW